MIRVLILDDHTVLCGALRRLIDGEQDLTVVAEAAAGAEALRLAETMGPEVALVDLSLGEESAIPVIRALCRLERAPRVVVLTMHAERSRALEAFAAGAQGYLLKSAPVEDVLRAIRTAAEGGVPLDPSVAAAVLPLIAGRVPAEPEERLTPREQEVRELVSAGLRNREIAARLHLSEKTVKHHVGQVLQKLGLPSRRGLRDHVLRPFERDGTKDGTFRTAGSEAAAADARLT